MTNLRLHRANTAPPHKVNIEVKGWLTTDRASDTTKVTKGPTFKRSS